MRQQGQVAFCIALNNMAEGCMTDDDETLLRNRQISPRLQPPTDAIWLFRTNKACKEYNDNYHKSLGTEGIVSRACDEVRGTIYDSTPKSRSQRFHIF